LAGTDDADEQNNTILSWLQGVPLSRSETRPFSVYEPIKTDNSRDMVRSMILMLRAMGYRGLVALFDELERILEQAPKARNKAYQTVRQLLDNADGSGTKWLYILFAITGELLTAQKGFREYDALWERVRTDVAPQTGKPDKRAIVIDLEMTPFEEDQLKELARKVRAIHADAYSWDAEAQITDAVIDAYVKELFESRHGLSVSAPRVLVKSVTDILDRSEQDATYVPDADVSGEIANALTALEDDRKKKIWD
jgi:adenosylhomocysteinase